MENKAIFCNSDKKEVIIEAKIIKDRLSIIDDHEQFQNWEELIDILKESLEIAQKKFELSKALRQEK